MIELNINTKVSTTLKTGDKTSAKKLKQRSVNMQARTVGLGREPDNTGGGKLTLVVGSVMQSCF